jgi:hypothetical protein
MDSTALYKQFASRSEVLSSQQALACWSLPWLYSLTVVVLAAVGSHRSGIWVPYPHRKDMAAAKELDLIAALSVQCQHNHGVQLLNDRTKECTDTCG